MSFYYYYDTNPTTVQTPEDEALDERWDIIDLNDASTKTPSSFEPYHATYYQPLKLKEEEHLFDNDNQQNTPLSPPCSDTLSQDFISSYFREEIMDDSEIQETNMSITDEEEETPDYFDVPRNMNMPIIEEEEEEYEYEEAPDYFDIPTNANMPIIETEEDEEEEEEEEEEEREDDVEDETIPLERVSILEQQDNVENDITLPPKSLLDYHQGLVEYYKTCLMKQVSENELLNNLQHLSIL